MSQQLKKIFEKENLQVVQEIVNKDNKQIYRVRPRSNKDKQYILKINILENDSTTQSLKPEIDALKSVEHQNILKVHKYKEYMVENSNIKKIEVGFLEPMEKDLYAYIQENFPTVQTAQVKNYIYQIAQALNYLHNQQNIAHQDLKPENIGLSGDRAVLMDFEFSKNIKLMNDTELLINNWKNRSTLYQSPLVYQLIKLINKYGETTSKRSSIESKAEQIDWKKNDVFGLGVTLFSCLFYQSPFQDGNSSKNDTLYGHFFDKNYAKFWESKQISYFLNEISKQGEDVEQLKDLIEKMLCYEQNQRIDIQAVLSHPWFSTI